MQTVSYITEKLFYKLNAFTFNAILMLHLACVQIVTWMDTNYVCSAILVSIQPVSNITEKVIYKYNLSLSHVRSCMCENCRYLDGYPLFLLCYTGITLACKLYK